VVVVVAEVVGAAEVVEDAAVAAGTVVGATVVGATLSAGTVSKVALISAMRSHTASSS
jgi:hypothetical protein